MTIEQALNAAQRRIAKAIKTLEAVEYECITLNPRLTEPFRKNNEALLKLVRDTLQELRHD